MAFVTLCYTVIIAIITIIKVGNYVFACVCLSVCIIYQDISRMDSRIITKLS